MGTLLDTSVLIGLERGYSTVPPTESLGIAAITVSELLHGLHRATTRHRLARQAFLERVFANVPTVPFTHEIARIHAELRADTGAAGRQRNSHDLMIAATAVALGWDLATADHRGFEDIPGLRVRYV